MTCAAAVATPDPFNPLYGTRDQTQASEATQATAVVFLSLCAITGTPSPDSNNFKIIIILDIIMNVLIRYNN